MTRTSGSTTRRAPVRRSPRKPAPVFDEFSDDDDMHRAAIGTPSPSKAVRKARAEAKAHGRSASTAKAVVKRARPASRRAALVMGAVLSTKSTTTRKRAQKRQRASSPGTSTGAARRVKARKGSSKGVLPTESQQKTAGVSHDVKAASMLLRMKLTASLHDALPAFGALGGVPKEGLEKRGVLTFGDVDFDTLKWALRGVAAMSANASRAPTAYQLFVADALSTGSKRKGKGVAPKERIRAAAAAWRAASDATKKEYKEKAAALADDLEDGEPTTVKVTFSKSDMRKLERRVLLSKFVPNPTQRRTNAFLGPSGLVMAVASFTKVALQYSVEKRQLEARWSCVVHRENADEA